jgi:hypothetical protein
MPRDLRSFWFVGGRGRGRGRAAGEKVEERPRSMMSALRWR